VKVIHLAVGGINFEFLHSDEFQQEERKPEAVDSPEVWEKFN
jgi:hypothetical protein